MSETEPEQSHADTSFPFLGGNLALDLVNTEVMERGKQHDLLTTPQTLESWWQAARRHYPKLDEWCGANEELIVYDLTLLNAVKILRTALRGLFSALVAASTPEQADVAALNAVLRTGYASLDLSGQGQVLSVYHTTDPHKGPILLPIALSALDLIQNGERKRLHQCENERCILFFYDTTRSATRRWCSLGCMDRARSSQRYRRAKQQS
jgi:predicted RNA-binding Zn ribbon-like protein